MAGATLRTIDYSVLQQCMHCGMCLPTCPTYDQTKHERNSPRGRIALMRAVADGALDVTQEFAEEMSYCLGCLACQTACPAGVNYAELFETARSDIELNNAQPGLARRFWRGLTLGFLFMHPRALRLRRTSDAHLSAQRTRVVRPTIGCAATSCLPRCAASSRRRRAWPIDFRTALIAPHEQPAGPARYRVAMLTGCVQDLVFPDVNRDTVDVLLANGCAVDTPAVQPCCGSLHAHNGDLRRARALARRMIDLFPPDRYDAIISNAGGCGSHLRHYGPLLAHDAAYRDRARLWDDAGARRPGVVDRDRLPAAASIPVQRTDNDHVPRVVPPGARAEDLAATSRDAAASCPVCRWWSCRSRAGAAALRASIRSPSRCRPSGCSAARPPTSSPQARAWVATANPGCHLQVARGLSAAGTDIHVAHPVSLLARAYRREHGPSA